MKQIIVMISMVVLGIAIAAVVLGFKDDVQTLGTSAASSITALNSGVTSATTALNGAT